MEPVVKTAKISRKGQVTLPKAVREALGTDVVRLEVRSDGAVSIIPIRDLAGSLASFATRYIPLDAARDMAAEAVSREHRRRR
jgi:AbrB family looped-hinge helix DNA binding protein